MPAIAALHYREDLFPNPDEFRPERFLDGKPDTYAWIPFGGGVRRCIGAAFAEYEMRIVLREIRRAGRSQRPRPEAGKGQGPQHHPRPRQGNAGQPGLGRCADLGFGCLPLLVELGDRLLRRGVPRFRPLGAPRARPGCGVGELLLQLAQLGLGLLYPLGEATRFARRFLRRPAGIAAGRRRGAGLAACAAVSPAASFSSRSRW